MPATSKPVKYSPLYHRLASMGANFSEVSGWLVASRFVDARQEAQSAQSAIGLCDLSSADLWEAQGADLEQLLVTVLGGRVPDSGQSMLCADGYVCRLSQKQALFVFDSEGRSVLSKLNDAAGSSGCLHWVDRTSGFGRLLLCGPQARSVLRKVTPFDVRESAFPGLHCAWTPMAGVRVLLVRRDRRDLPAYEILVSREYAEYLWDAVMEAGREYQMRPCGFESVRLLGAL